MDHRQANALVHFLEAAYCVEMDDEGWLPAVTKAVAAVTRHALAGMHSAIYDASDVTAFRPTMLNTEGPSEMREILLEGVGLFTPRLIARTFRSLLFHPSGRTVATPEMNEMYSKLDAIGLPDGLCLNAFDPTGVGVFLQLFVPKPVEMEGAERALFRRIAHHLGAAHRVRRRLRSSGPLVDPADGAEAILDGRRRVVHASGPAKNKAVQAALVETSKARDVAFSSRGDRTLRRWQPLTDARWTLVDRFERGGARYIVARENQAQVQGFLSLSDRERQIVAYVALGQSTKETAYALGISDTTVRVHLKHAATKLGVRTRGQLLRHPEVRNLLPQAEERHE